MTGGSSVELACWIVLVVIPVLNKGAVSAFNLLLYKCLNLSVSTYKCMVVCGIRIINL